MSVKELQIIKILKQTYNNSLVTLRNISQIIRDENE